MATYTELYGLMADTAVRNKVTAACLVMANTIRLESDVTTNHANRLLWAKLVYEQPDYIGELMLRAVLSQNASATVAQITGATDATILSAVSSAVDIFAIGVAV